MLHQIDWHYYFIFGTFLIGYLCIIFEEKISINKATSALLMSVVMWGLQFSNQEAIAQNAEQLSEHLASVTQVILFLLGALTIVEIIHAHGGLSLISRFMDLRSKVASLWVIGGLAFFLSSVLDNLTTTIVLVTMLKKVIENKEERFLFGGAVVIAANAGGAWTPIGDITTTMLWVGGQITTPVIMRALFIPSLACCIAALACFSVRLKGQCTLRNKQQIYDLAPKGKRVFFLGILSLVSVPIFKQITGLPPFMGILFAMSFMWLVTDFLHHKHADRQNLRVSALLPRLDLSGILFFLGILLSVGALDTAGILHQVSMSLDQLVSSRDVIAVIVGVLSAIVDNVPLVAGAMGMYDLVNYGPDHSFWLLLAYCAGTGGSLLIIGSAAGVAFMGLEKVDFFWYAKRISVAAGIGYLVGIGVYYLTLC